MEGPKAYSLFPDPPHCGIWTRSRLFMILVDYSTPCGVSCQAGAFMRRQFVLDEQSERLLDRLAATRAGNRSFVVREAIALYAGLEDRLAEIEEKPGFRRLMRQTAA